MGANFYFFDLETSGFNPRTARIMQFAGQRTDKDLNPIGKPDNILIKLTEDVLPEPDAILVTGITPQATLSNGITEAEFLQYFCQQIVTPDTIMVGFNNIRFDNEFMRFTLWRNFYDAYEWAWKDGCSTWDLLDVVRMTRALRPDGIKWPFASDGTPSNKLEYLTNINKLEHANAHDALSDVLASLDVAKLIKSKQPKLFDYLLNIRSKHKVAPLVTKGEPIIYTSGRYPSGFEKTTVAVMVATHPEKDAAIMYDLRVDPKEFINLSAEELAKKWQAWGKDVPYFPLKVLQYNRCPAIAPMSVLDDESTKRLKLNKSSISKNLKTLGNATDFVDKLIKALEIMKPKVQPQLVIDEQTVDERLYDGFIKDEDKTKMRVVRAAGPEELSELGLDFKDERLKVLLPLYKARNYPSSLSPEERESWEKFKFNKLMSGGNASRAAKYFNRLSELSADAGLNAEAKYLLEELQLYAESVLPLVDA